MQSFLMASTLYAILAAALCSASSLGYPVFGTKRYARANLLPSSEYGSSSLPVYSPVVPQQQQLQQQYYDSQPQYMPQYASSDYYDDNGYYGGNNYYYVPPVVHRRHQRHDRYPSYGLPTYRGEYKPTPYYYAHAPSYSYSDDRESNNPLDDLHEEMLQEDERERAREYMPVGTEQWYENLPPRHAPDSTFLRNLIMYNQQMNALRNKQQLDSTEEYDEYEDSEPEYYDSSAYVDNRNNYNAFVNPYTGSSNTPIPSSGNNRNTFNKISSLRNSMAKNAVEDDEEVQELKSLIHQQKNSRLQQQQLLQQQPQPQQQYQVHTPNPMQDIKQQQQRSISNDYSQFNMDSTFQQDSPQQQQPQQYTNYEYDNEYDDNWSHWDRKRNVQPKKVTPTTTSTTTSTATPTTTTTTPKPIVEIIHGHNGQKEVVLPRPASPVRNPFANIGGLQKAQKPAAPAASSSMDANVVAAAPPAGKLAKPGSVYDTIKKIISMQQNLEDAELSYQLDSQKHQGSGRLQKRFVASEESLVQQLDGLKRTA